MKQILTLLFMFGLALSGVEGAVDAVSVDHSDGSAGIHEEHHQHAGDDRAHDDDPHDDKSDDGDDHPDRDSAGHAHYCHCGMHVPPMAFTTVFSMQVLHDSRPAFIQSLHIFLADSPLLRPPIA